jgi:4-carboxymuconolactone decarboxylase
MTNSRERIVNLPREKWTDEARQVFSFWGEPDAWENGSRTNPVMVMANHPKLAMAYNAFGRQILLESTLPVRPRELVVLRTSWHLKAEYEWHYHVGYAIAAGMTIEEISAIRFGPASPVWADKDDDRSVLEAVDGLLKNSQITDENWAVLALHFDQKQLMDLVFTVGNYVMFAWAIAAFGVPLEDGVDKIGFDLQRSSGAKLGASHRPGETDDWADNSGR